MTKLDELKTDLASHTKTLAAMSNAKYKAPFPAIKPHYLIPSYKKIIKSIEDEIATIEAKKKNRKSK